MADVREAIELRCRDLETEILVRQAVVRELRGLLADLGPAPAPKTPAAVQPLPAPPPATVANGHAPAPAPRKKPGPPGRWPEQRKVIARYLAANGPQSGLVLATAAGIAQPGNGFYDRIRNDPWFGRAEGGKYGLTSEGWGWVRGEAPSPRAGAAKNGEARGDD